MIRRTKNPCVPLVLFTSLCLSSTMIHAGEVTPSGRVAFDFANAPPATVELDLRSGTLSVLSEIANSAVEGVVEGLKESSGSPAVLESSEHLTAVNEILGLASQAVQEVRVRVYENVAEPNVHGAMFKHYQDKLKGTDWENVVRVRDNNESIVVCVQQHGSAFHGFFVMVSDGDELILANVVCQLTPERIKQITNQATKVGMKFGLEDAIEQAMRELGPSQR